MESNEAVSEHTTLYVGLGTVVGKCKHLPLCCSNDHDTVEEYMRGGWISDEPETGTYEIYAIDVFEEDIRPIIEFAESGAICEVHIEFEVIIDNKSDTVAWVNTPMSVPHRFGYDVPVDFGWFTAIWLEDLDLGLDRTDYANSTIEASCPFIPKVLNRKIYKELEMNTAPHENTQRTISADDLSAILDEVLTRYALPVFLYTDRYDSALLPTTQSVMLDYCAIDTPAHYRDDVVFISPVSFEPTTLTGMFENCTKYSVRLNVFKDAVDVILITKMRLVRRVEDNLLIFEHKE